MAKARRQVTEKLKLIDVVIELVDARVPQSSRNPMVDEITAGKPRLIVLNKADMADPVVTDAWLRALKREEVEVVAVDAKHSKGLKQLITGAQKLMKEKHDRMREKGRNPGPIRALIIGIPNVGKSTLINRLAGRNIAITGDRPGVTKRQQWIKMKGGEMELLDTPGILWPKFEDQLVGLKLALTGAIKDDLLPMDEVTIFGLNHFLKNYRSMTMKRYRMTEEDLELEIPDLIMELTARFGFRDDYDRFYNMFVKDVRDGKLGLFCLDEVGTDEL